jgi:hypothetical protein
MPRAIVDGQPLSSLPGGTGATDRDFGDGTLGDVTIAAPMDLSGDLHYNSLVVNDGVRVSAAALTKLTVRTRADLTLNGSAVIDAHGRGYAPDAIGGAGGIGSESTDPSGISDAPSAPPVSRPFSPIALGGTGSGGGGGGMDLSVTRTGGTGGVAGSLTARTRAPYLRAQR